MDVVPALSILGNLALVVGVLVGLVQLRHLSRQRDDDMVLRAYSPFLDQGFSRAFWTVLSWKFETYDQFEEEATLEDKVTLDVVEMLFEMMGALYARGLARLDLLDDLMAVQTIMVWNKIAPLVYGFRERENQPDWSRWHEGLALALDKRMTELGEVHVPVVQPRAAASQPSS